MTRHRWSGLGDAWVRGAASSRTARATVEPKNCGLQNGPPSRKVDRRQKEQAGQSTGDRGIEVARHVDDFYREAFLCSAFCRIKRKAAEACTGVRSRA